MGRLFLSIVAICVLISHTLAEPKSERLLQGSSYTPSSVRGATVSNFCSAALNRDSLYDKYGLTGEIPHSGSVTSAFDFNSTLIDLALEGKWNQFGDKLRGAGGKLFAYLGAWVIGLAIALLVWPFLLCCCICPWSCPPCNKKRQNMPYTKCEMIWPAIFTLTFLTIIFVTSIVGISSKFKADKNYNEVACAAGVIFDDFIYGNVSLTTPKTYFKGVRNIDTELRQMNNKITLLNEEIAKLGSSSSGMTDAMSKLTTAKTSTAQIPSTTQASLSLSYKTPLQQPTASTTSSIQSIFPAILGDKNTEQSFVGAAYLSLSIYEKILGSVSSFADQYNSNSASYTSEINKVLDETNRYATDLEEEDSKVNDFFKTSNSGFKGVTTGEYVYFGVLIGLSAVMILAVSCTVFCMSDKCRYLMYTICVVLFFFCLVAFIYCIIVSIINPILYYSCQYVEENLSSKAKLKDTMINRLSFQSQIAGNVSECLAADGDGDLVKNILGDSVFTAITTFNSTYSNLININTSLISPITQIHNSLLQNVSAFKSAKSVDITDEASLSQLIKLSQASNYGCSSAGFNSDSWVPANNQVEKYVSCQFANGPNSSSSTCTSSTAFDNRDVGCTGCMDTYDLFMGNTSQATVSAALSSRYPDSSCATFNAELSNVWDNFYRQKRDVIGPVQTRAQTAKTNSEAVVGTADYFVQVKGKIQTNFISIVDSQFGLLKGLDCETTSSDIRLLKNVVCQGLFMYTYFARVIFGILSFALLFLMCCTVCTGHRNAKQFEFDQTKAPYENNLISPPAGQGKIQSQQKFMYGGQQNAYAKEFNGTQNIVNPYALPNSYNSPYNYP